MRLNASEKAAIQSAIQAAERRSTGQILVAIVPKSGDYTAVSLAFALLLAFAATLLLWFLRPSVSVPLLVMAQLFVLIASELLLRWSGMDVRLAPAVLRRRTVGSRAREQFLFEGVHATEARNGILIFLSLHERMAELVVDRGIESRAPKDAWHRLVRNLSTGLCKKALLPHLLQTIEQCGAMLAQHYPVDPENTQPRPNALPDAVHELP